MLGILDFNFDEFLAWVGEDMDTLMMLIWIIPVIVFVFYGQRIQLLISSNEIKKDIEKLEEYTTSTKKDFLNYVKNNLTPFNQSTNAPDDAARVVLPAVPIEASNAY